MSVLRSAGLAIPDAPRWHRRRETAGHFPLGLEARRAIGMRLLPLCRHWSRRLFAVHATQSQGGLGHRLDIRSQPLGAGTGNVVLECTQHRVHRRIVLLVRHLWSIPGFQVYK